MKRLSVAERADAVSRAACLVRQSGRELQARLLVAPPSTEADAVRWAAGEVAQASDDLDRIASLICHVDGVRRMGHQPGELNHYFYQPRGLVLALTSSRQPLTSACTIAGAALAAGNPVVLKPDSGAGEGTAYLARLLIWAGFPADAVGFLPVSRR